MDTLNAKNTLIVLWKILLTQKPRNWSCDTSQKICVQGLLSLSCLFAGCIFDGTPLTYSTGTVGQTVTGLSGLQGQGGEDIDSHSCIQLM